MFSILRTSVLALISMSALQLLSRSDAIAQHAAKSQTRNFPEFAAVDVVAVDKNFKKVRTSVGGLRFSVVIPMTYKVKGREKSTFEPYNKCETLVFSAQRPGQAASVIVMVVSEGPSVLACYLTSPLELVKMSMTKFSHQFSDYKQSNSSIAELNGNQFGTVTFEGRDAVVGPHLVHGFAYVGLVHYRMLVIQGFDLGVKPNDLPTLQKAVQSIKFE